MQKLLDLTDISTKYLKFYENIGHRELRAKAQQLGFPEEVIGLALAAYTSVRHIAMGSMPAKGLGWIRREVPKMVRHR